MNRIIILLTALIFISTTSLINAQYLQDMSLHKNTTGITDSNLQTQSKNTKSPYLAGALSFIVPGLAFGQIYNNQPLKFLTHICITGACIIGASIGKENFIFDVGGGGGKSSGIWLILLSGAVFIANWTVSIVDAVSSANEINLHAARKKSHSDIMNKINFGFTIAKNNKINLKIVFGL